MQDEQCLVQKARDGDKEAFAQLYESHVDKIYRYLVLKTGNKIEAEDMTQQVFLKAFQSISSFKWQGTPFTAWLFRIAHNLMVDYMRHKEKRATLPLDEPIAKSDSNPELMAERKLDMEQVISATERLTELQRGVISLRFTSELSIAEVARVMGKSEGAIKALQHSAIAALRKSLLVGETQ